MRGGAGGGELSGGVGGAGVQRGIEDRRSAARY